MLKVLICDLWSVGPSGLPAGSVSPVCRTLSKLFGFWNHDLVKPRFSWIESAFDS
jgi:hypothetical protein